MKRSIVLSLALIFAPTAALAQAAPPPPPGPGLQDAGPPSAAQAAAMEQMHAQTEQLRIQTRSRILASLTPAHRTAVANIAGQLVLAVNPDPRAAALSLDAILTPGEKQSVLNVAAAERSSMHALMQQRRAAFESSLTADERARMAERESKMQAFRQSHPRPEENDPGAIVLRTLANLGGPGGMHGHPM